MLITSLACIPANGQGVRTENQSGMVQQLPGQNPHSFIGNWLAQTQITDCRPLENSKFVSNNAGGTAQEMSNSLPPCQRTVAFDVWQHLEERNFVYALRFFRFTPKGTFSNIVLRHQNTVGLFPNSNVHSSAFSPERDAKLRDIALRRRAEEFLVVAAEV